MFTFFWWWAIGAALLTATPMAAALVAAGSEDARGAIPAFRLGSAAQLADRAGPMWAVGIVFDPNEIATGSTPFRR